MILTITIDLDNAIFQDCDLGSELQTILKNAAYHVASMDASKAGLASWIGNPRDLWDANGTRIGHFSLTKNDEQGESVFDKWAIGKYVTVKRWINGNAVSVRTWIKITHRWSNKDDKELRAEGYAGNEYLRLEGYEEAWLIRYDGSGAYTSAIPPGDSGSLTCYLTS